MPTYEYKREDGSRFEILQKMSDPALKICPNTGQKVKRVVSGGGGVVYKGEGWYVTDYKNSGQKKEADDPKKSVNKNSETVSSENESKPSEKKTSSEKK